MAWRSLVEVMVRLNPCSRISVLFSSACLVRLCACVSLARRRLAFAASSNSHRPYTVRLLLPDTVARSPMSPGRACAFRGLSVVAPPFFPLDSCRVFLAARRRAVEFSCRGLPSCGRICRAPPAVLPPSAGLSTPCFVGGMHILGRPWVLATVALSLPAPPRVPHSGGACLPYARLLWGGRRALAFSLPRRRAGAFGALMVRSVRCPL